MTIALIQKLQRMCLQQLPEVKFINNKSDASPLTLLDVGNIWARNINNEVSSVTQNT